jgi:hypothetical protein
MNVCHGLEAFTRLEVIEPVEETKDRALACARLANEGNAPSAGNFEGNVFERGGYAVIGEGDIFCGNLVSQEGSACTARTELDFAILNYQLPRIGCINHRRLGKEIQ